MTVVQSSVQIKASPQTTMERLSDAARWPDWYPGMSNVDITPPFPDQGGKVSFKVKSAGLTLPITETVVEFDSERLQVLEMEGALSGRARWECSAQGDGTMLTTTFDYALAGGFLGRIADALMAKRMNAKALEQGLQNFKVLVERQ